MMNKRALLKRRKHFLNQIGQDAIAIMPAAEYDHYLLNYRQDHDFYYLTGFKEAQAVAVFVPGHAKGDFVLFNRADDPQESIWNGKLVGQEGACQQYGADMSYPIELFDEKIIELLEGRSRLIYPVGRYAQFDKKITDMIKALKKKQRLGVAVPSQIEDSDAFLHAMRLIKDEEDLAHMRKAADISIKAHKAMMKACQPGMYEYELQAIALYEFKRGGGQGEAYSSIIGAGENSCVLHYTANSERIVDGDLVLVDAGVDYGYYAADITRTFPANGIFSEEQKAIYELVLKVQCAVIDEVRPGVPFNVLQDKAVRILTEGLVHLGLLKGKVETLLKNQAYKDYFMHGIGHWLGMDVHDVGAYKLDGEWRVLEPGMVFTVEPGIYLSGKRLNIDRRWQGIGVRIEDNVLVTETGHEVLTSDLPKTVADIEALMAS